MKILHIGQLIGGLDVYIRNAITYSSDDTEFVIVHGDDDGSSPVIKNNKQIKEYKVALQRKVSLWHDSKCLFQVRDIIRKEKPDLIHCHSAKGGVISEELERKLDNPLTCFSPQCELIGGTDVDILNTHVYKTIRLIHNKAPKLFAFLQSVLYYINKLNKSRHE